MRFGIKRYLFFGAGAENVAFLFNKRSVFRFVPCFSAWKADNSSVSQLVVFECVNVDSVRIVERSVVFDDTDAVRALKKKLASVLQLKNMLLTARTKYLLLWKPTFPKPCIIKDFPCIPGARPTMSMYFFVLQKMCVPW